MKVFSQLIVVALLGATGGGAWYYKDRLPFLGPPAAAEKRGGFSRAVSVEVVSVRTGRVTIVVEAVGTAIANEAVTITTKVTGLVKRIAFREGQKVKAGMVLVALDASELEAELEEARAERDNARRLLDRAKRLLASRNVPQARVDVLTSELEAAEARVRADEARLADYVVRAPFSGRLGLRRVSLGALVEPGDEITTLDDVIPIKLDFQVPESSMSRLAPGQHLSASGVAFPERTFTGKVVTIGSRVDPVTRSIAVRALIPNDDEVLKPGMFLTVTLIADEREDAMLIPEEALVSTGSSHFVFVVAGDKAVRTAVTLGQRLPGEVEVRSGLEPGMLIIVGGLQKVRDGASVKILEPGATS